MTASRLRPGDPVAVIAPASCPDMRALRRGIRTLEARGYRVKLGKHVGRKMDHLGGRDVDRIEDFRKAYADPEVKAVFAARGGSGCTRLLSRLPFDLVRDNPVPLVGFSDLTALQLALFAKSGLRSVSGPMVATDFDEPRRFTTDHFWPLLESPDPMPFRLKKPLTFTGDRPAEGLLLGGTLSILQTLLGTPFLPDFTGAILFIEDVTEEVRRIDRTLAQLRLAGIWSRVAGVVFCTWSECGPAAALRRTLSHAATALEGRPCVFGFPNGHVRDKVSLPIGARARIDPGKKTFELLEGVVK